MRSFDLFEMARKHVCVAWARLMCLVAFVVLGFGAPSLAQRPQIRLDSVFPSGAQAGSDATIAIAGELTEAATELLFSHPGIEATQQVTAATEYATAHRKPRTFDVRVGPDVPDGRYEVRALGPIGLSGPRCFSVSRLAEKRFDAGVNSKQKPFGISVGEVANAAGRPDQHDYYRFSAKQGTSLLIQVWAERIDSRMDAELAVYDSTGNRLARVRQTQSRDPIMTFQAPADGDYIIEVWDATFRGGADYGYRLEVSERPYVEGIHPAIAQAGVQGEYTLFGYNLPGGVPVSGVSGVLQSATVTFAPDLDSESLAAALPMGSISSARLNGGAVSLPVPFSMETVFVQQAETAVLREVSNDSHDSAQVVTAPCSIAGQFYPRRDVDWYRFDAKKGQSFQIELATEQLGTNSDPLLRVGRAKETDGKTEFAQLGVSDDLEASPRTRDDRRLFSGTPDSGYRFRADQDGSYLVAVSDQYNSSSDDPRLVYGLTIREEKPDFQLLAFADPERHNDIKIAKPNGVSLAPGDTTMVRVRLLPQHGFKGEVEVTADSLPLGVEAHPLVLSTRQREGFLVLSASKQAKKNQSSIRITGTSNHGDTSVSRVARTVAIRRGNNNIDQTPTDSRLCHDLVVAVVESKPPPVSFTPITALVTSVGAKVKVPVTLARHESVKDVELQIEAATLPAGVKVAAKKTKGTRVNIDLDLTDKNLKSGRITLPLATKLKTRRPRNQLEFDEAEADLAKASKILSLREESLFQKMAVQERLAKVISTAKISLKNAESVSNGPRGRLAAKLTELQQVATKLADNVKASVSDVGNKKLSAAIDATQDRLVVLREERSKLQMELSRFQGPVDELSKLVAAQESELKSLQLEVDALTKKRDEAATKKKEAEKRVADVRKAQMEKDAEYYVYSKPIEIELLDSPLSLRTVRTVQVTPGDAVQVPISIQRRFRFVDRVVVSATAKVKGMTVGSVVIGAGLTTAQAEVLTSKETPVGKHVVKMESTITFNGVEIRDHVECIVEVVAGKE